MNATQGEKIIGLQNLFKTYSSLGFTKVSDRPVAVDGIQNRLLKAFDIQGGSDCDPADTHTPCLPYNLDGSGKRSSWSKWGFFSPDLECPQGWTTATSISYGMTITGPEKSGLEGALSLLDVGETAAMCCPVGIPLNRVSLPVLDRACILDEFKSEYQVIPCYGNNGMKTFTVTISSYTSGSLYTVAPVVQLVWQPTDKPTSSITTPDETNTSSDISSSSATGSSAISSPPSSISPSISPVNSNSASSNLDTNGETPSILTHSRPTANTVTGDGTTVILGSRQTVSIATNDHPPGMSSAELAAIIVCSCIFAIALGSGFGMWYARRRVRNKKAASKIQDNQEKAAEKNTDEYHRPRS